MTNLIYDQHVLNRTKFTKKKDKVSRLVPANVFMLNTLN